MEVRKSITVGQLDESGISWHVTERSDRVLGSEPGILEFVIPDGVVTPQAIVYGTQDLDVPLEVTGMCRIIGSPVPVIFYHPLKIICFDFLLSNVPDIALITLRRNGKQWEIPAESSIIIGRESKHTFGAFSEPNMTSLTVTRSLTLVSSYTHFYGETIVRNIFSYTGSDANIDLAMGRLAENVRQLAERIHVPTCHSPTARKSADQDLLHPMASILWNNEVLDLAPQPRCLVIDKSAIVESDQLASFSAGMGTVIFLEGHGTDRQMSRMKCGELQMTSQGCIIMNSQIDCSISLTCISEKKTYVMSGSRIVCGTAGKLPSSWAMAWSSADDLRFIESKLLTRGRTAFNANTMDIVSVDITSEQTVNVNAIKYKQEKSKIMQLSKEDTLKVCANIYEHCQNSESTSEGDLHIEFVPTPDQKKNQTVAIGECIRNISSRIFAARDVLLRLRLASFGQNMGNLVGNGNMRIECADLVMEKESTIRADGNLSLTCSKFQSSRKSSLSIGGFCDFLMQKGVHQLGCGTALF